MRWIASLVTAVCLLAVGGARPERAGARDSDVARIQASPAVVAWLAPRRDARPDQRLPLFTLPSQPEARLPAAAVASAVPRVVVDLVDLPPPAPSARGPPG